MNSFEYFKSLVMLGESDTIFTKIIHVESRHFVQLMWKATFLIHKTFIISSASHHSSHFSTTTTPQGLLGMGFTTSAIINENFLSNCIFAFMAKQLAVQPPSYSNSLILMSLHAWAIKTNRFHCLYFIFTDWKSELILIQSRVDADEVQAANYVIVWKKGVLI